RRRRLRRAPRDSGHRRRDRGRHHWLRHRWRLLCRRRAGPATGGHRGHDRRRGGPQRCGCAAGARAPPPRTRRDRLGRPPLGGRSGTGRGPRRRSQASRGCRPVTDAGGAATGVTAMNVGVEIDLLDGDFYVGDPYPTYAWLRQHAPCYWDGTNELWGVSRYDDVVEIEKRKELFVSSDTAKGGSRPNIPADASFINADDPYHHQRRNLVSRRFTPRAVGQREAHVRETVAALFDA